MKASPKSYNKQVLEQDLLSSLVDSKTVLGTELICKHFSTPVNKTGAVTDPQLFVRGNVSDSDASLLFPPVHVMHLPGVQKENHSSCK